MPVILKRVTICIWAPDRQGMERASLRESSTKRAFTIVRSVRRRSRPFTMPVAVVSAQINVFSRKTGMKIKIQELILGLALLLLMMTQGAFGQPVVTWVSLLRGTLRIGLWFNGVWIF